MFSFSSKRLLALVILGCLPFIQSICEAQESIDPESDTAAPNDAVNFNMPMAPAIQEEAVQEKPVVPEHPPVVERSHAALMPLSAVALPATAMPPQPKSPLAWRAKSGKLGNDRFNDDTAIQVGPLCRNVDRPYVETIQTVITACNTAGYRLTNVNKAAGELLACSVSDPNCRIVFAIWEKPAGRTWVKAGVERGSGSSLTTQIISILDTACGTITPKGKI